MTNSKLQSCRPFSVCREKNYWDEFHSSSVWVVGSEEGNWLIILMLFLLVLCSYSDWWCIFNSLTSLVGLLRMFFQRSTPWCLASLNNFKFKLCRREIRFESPLLLPPLSFYLFQSFLNIKVSPGSWDSQLHTNISSHFVTMIKLCSLVITLKFGQPAFICLSALHIFWFSK